MYRVTSFQHPSENRSLRARWLWADVGTILLERLNVSAEVENAIEFYFTISHKQAARWAVQVETNRSEIAVSGGWLRQFKGIIRSLLKKRAMRKALIFISLMKVTGRKCITTA